MAEVKPIERRSCNGCTLCCKLMSVEELGKPQGRWCEHCNIGKGCGIYETRPGECHRFNCQYLMNPHIGRHWRPETAKMVVVRSATSNRVTVFVDPDHPDVWRQPIYYRDIRRWAIRGLEARGQVLVSVDRQVTAVLPDRDQPLGAVRDGQVIVYRGRRGASGLEVEALVVPEDDPIEKPSKA